MTRVTVDAVTPLTWVLVFIPPSTVPYLQEHVKHYFVTFIFDDLKKIIAAFEICGETK